MFTGIIEEIGHIKEISHIRGGTRIKISCSSILAEMKEGCSICVGGVCLTAVKIDNDGFWAEAVGETLAKSTFNELCKNSSVNLERALRFNDRLNGHLVQGHVNGTTKIIQLKQIGENYILKFYLPIEFLKYVILEGSITIDGISLTVAGLNETEITLSIIPYTFNNTTLKYKKANDYLNFEVDMIAKYLERFVNSNINDAKLTETKLKEMGY